MLKSTVFSARDLITLLGLDGELGPFIPETIALQAVCPEGPVEITLVGKLSDVPAVRYAVLEKHANGLPAA